MGYEISQFDILNRQLMASKPQPGSGKAWDIGEAKVTRTLFGRARVRVIRDQDRKRRAWLLAVLFVAAAAATAWEGWVIFQRVGHKPPPVPLSQRIWVSPPVFRPAHIAPDPYQSKRKPESLIQSEINSMLSGPLPRHPPPGLKAKSIIAEERIASESMIKNKPLAVEAEATKTASVDKSGKPDNRSAAIQTAAKTVANAPSQPSVNQPAEPVQVADPLVKGGAATASPAGNDQPPDPSRAQD